ncbi:hypothetical protein B0H10DRAFT_599752 [Mycena sp. CBHHK59/15]|nr:hypothetical protein B0H10DRAFT_599752 [Mycena sp. CBHHK59/15]
MRWASTRQNEKPRTALEIPARVEPHSGLPSGCPSSHFPLSSLPTDAPHARRAGSGYMTHSSVLRPPSHFASYPSFPHPHPVHSLRSLSCVPIHTHRQDGSPTRWRAAARNTTSPPRCER